ncbi:MAG: RHS repeat-associated core domain-containing protein, partial [Clostridia bacterium]|nr:RHS repeat-associated core domain-containing protein [Clostridia bacterium]
MTNKNRAGTILSSFAYTYSADGNILTEVDHTGGTTAYTYDLLGRLVSEVGNSGSRFYTYDTAGNRTQVIIDTTTTISYNYNSDGSLASETSSNGSVSETTTYAYDLNGNLTAKTKGLSVTNYTYDVWGNMTSGAGATYAYNAQGLRVSKTVGNDTDNFTLVGGDVWSDSTTNYLRGIELISNGTQLYLYNVRGDVIQLLGFDGVVDKTYDYDAYGNELQRDSNDSNPFRYCGEYYDVETGFIYLRARYYDPMVGRFTSVDPIKDGLNWYAYCYN